MNKERSLKKKAIGVCEICNGEYEKKNHNQKYCKKCSPYSTGSKLTVVKEKVHCKKDMKMIGKSKVYECIVCGYTEYFEG